MGTEREPAIMTVNAGSSSIKLALYTDQLVCLLEISVADIGQPDAKLTKKTPSSQIHSQPAQANNRQAAAALIFDHISDEIPPEKLLAIGHRIVHGGQVYDGPVEITADVVDKLKAMVPIDPEHMQASIDLIEILRNRFPQAIQVACFDTAFYKDLPVVARLLPLPRKFTAAGLHRYGFHGLSYEFLLQKFGEKAGHDAANGRIVMAHLGSGASLTAVNEGKPVDTTMSFTPASGIPMSTRAGDLDPGIITFLHRQAGMSVDEFDRMVHFESGLLGVSGISADMELLIRESESNQQAAEAVGLFCYQVRKTIGGLAAALGGLDSLIFAGGIGENAPIVREKVCEGLDYLGLKLDPNHNANHDFLISSNDSNVGVHVIHTDEAAVIAKQTKQVIKKESS